MGDVKYVIIQENKPSKVMAKYNEGKKIKEELHAFQVKIGIIIM